MTVVEGQGDKDEKPAFSFCAYMGGVDDCHFDPKNKPSGAKERPLTGTLECSYDVTNRHLCSGYIVRET